MSKDYRDMNYTELLDEVERVKIAMLDSKSGMLKHDYSKYLRKLEKEIYDYEVFTGLR